MEKYLVSACLLGVNCKYNGKNNLNRELIDYIAGKEVFAVCPEVMGGMTIPRIPSEVQADKRVINQEGEDVTEYFVNGANKAKEVALENGIMFAILKNGSPSCGYNSIYDGSFSHKSIKAKGLFAELLIENGIEIIDLETWKIN